MPFGIAQTRSQISIGAYSRPTSVIAGEKISFQAAAWSGEGNYIPRARASIRIYRFSQLAYGQASDLPFKGRTDHLYTRDYRSFLTIKPHEQACFVRSFAIKAQERVQNAAAEGCGWETAVEWVVPLDARNGPYIAQISSEGTSTYVLFIVRPRRPGSSSRIVCQLSSNTYQAYNSWGGACFYKLRMNAGREESTAVQ